MKINYWECDYEDCDHYYDGDMDIHYEYGCTHPDNETKVCKLENKLGDDCDNCPFLNEQS